MKTHTFVICAYGKSKYLERSVLSVANQSVASKVVMCTSTPSKYIKNIADKYNIPLYVRQGPGNIRDDWNFAYNTAQTDYVTIVHQDDVYHKDYVKLMEKRLEKYSADEVDIFFTGYRPLKKGHISLDINCVLRAILRSPMLIKCFQNKKWWKTRILSLGNSICCPTVTYNKRKLKADLFTSDLLFNIDWDTFYKIANMDGYFVYEPKKLVLYRIHNEATSKVFIENHNRYKEDKIMFEKFWGKKFSSLIMKIYVKAYDTYS